VCPAARFAESEHGTSLIEMMIAILVLSVGLIGSVAVVSLAIGSNTRSRRDSTSAAVVEMVVGQISSIPVGGGVTTVTVNDCAGNVATMNTSGTAAGAGANLTSSNTIDFTQSYASVAAGYAMRYTVCGVTTSTESVYDVRWNIKTLPSGKGEFVVVGTRALNSSTKDPHLYALPVNVRTVVGNDGN
jgi:competence protein ComGC